MKNFSYKTELKFIKTYILDCSDTIDDDHKFEKSSDTDGFEDVSANLTSKVWGHFLLNKSEELAKCLHCSTLMKVPSGSTKGMAISVVEFQARGYKISYHNSSYSFRFEQFPPLNNFGSRNLVYWVKNRNLRQLGI